MLSLTILNPIHISLLSSPVRGVGGRVMGEKFGVSTISSSKMC